MAGLLRANTMDDVLTSTAPPKTSKSPECLSLSLIKMPRDRSAPAEGRTTGSDRNMQCKTPATTSDDVDSFAKSSTFVPTTQAPHRSFHAAQPKEATTGQTRNTSVTSFPTDSTIATASAMLVQHTKHNNFCLNSSLTFNGSRRQSPGCRAGHARLPSDGCSFVKKSGQTTTTTTTTTPGNADDYYPRHPRHPLHERAAALKEALLVASRTTNSDGEAGALPNPRSGTATRRSSHSTRNGSECGGGRVEEGRVNANSHGSNTPSPTYITTDVDLIGGDDDNVDGRDATTHEGTEVVELFMDCVESGSDEHHHGERSEGHIEDGTMTSEDADSKNATDESNTDTCHSSITTKKTHGQLLTSPKDGRSKSATHKQLNPQEVCRVNSLAALSWQLSPAAESPLLAEVNASAASALVLNSDDCGALLAVVAPAPMTAPAASAVEVGAFRSSFFSPRSPLTFTPTEQESGALLRPSPAGGVTSASVAETAAAAPRPGGHVGVYAVSNGRCVARDGVRGATAGPTVRFLPSSAASSTSGQARGTRSNPFASFGPSLTTGSHAHHNEDGAWWCPPAPAPEDLAAALTRDGRAVPASSHHSQPSSGSERPASRSAKALPAAPPGEEGGVGADDADGLPGFATHAPLPSATASTRMSRRASLVSGDSTMLTGDAAPSTRSMLTALSATSRSTTRTNSTSRSRSRSLTRVSSRSFNRNATLATHTAPHSGRTDTADGRHDRESAIPSTPCGNLLSGTPAAVSTACESPCCVELEDVDGGGSVSAPSCTHAPVRRATTDVGNLEDSPGLFRRARDTAAVAVVHPSPDERDPRPTPPDEFLEVDFLCADGKFDEDEQWEVGFEDMRQESGRQQATLLPSAAPPHDGATRVNGGSVITRPPMMPAQSPSNLPQHHLNNVPVTSLHVAPFSRHHGVPADKPCAATSTAVIVGRGAVVGGAYTTRRFRFSSPSPAAAGATALARRGSTDHPPPPPPPPPPLPPPQPSVIAVAEKNSSGAVAVAERLSGIGYTNFQANMRLSSHHGVVGALSLPAKHARATSASDAAKVASLARPDRPTSEMPGGAGAAPSAPETVSASAQIGVRGSDAANINVQPAPLCGHPTRSLPPAHGEKSTPGAEGSLRQGDGSDRRQRFSDASKAAATGVKGDGVMSKTGMAGEQHRSDDLVLDDEPPFGLLHCPRRCAATDSSASHGGDDHNGDDGYPFPDTNTAASEGKTRSTCNSGESTGKLVYAARDTSGEGPLLYAGGLTITPLRRGSLQQGSEAPRRHASAAEETAERGTAATTTDGDERPTHTPLSHLFLPAAKAAAKLPHPQHHVPVACATVPSAAASDACGMTVNSLASTMTTHSTTPSVGSFAVDTNRLFAVGLEPIQTLKYNSTTAPPCHAFPDPMSSPQEGEPTIKVMMVKITGTSAKGDGSDAQGPAAGNTTAAASSHEPQQPQCAAVTSVPPPPPPSPPSVLDDEYNRVNFFMRAVPEFMRRLPRGKILRGPGFSMTAWTQSLVKRVGDRQRSLQQQRREQQQQQCPSSEVTCDSLRDNKETQQQGTKEAYSLSHPPPPLLPVGGVLPRLRPSEVAARTAYNKLIQRQHEHEMNAQAGTATAATASALQRGAEGPLKRECLMVVRKVVYDVSDFLAYHPGGSSGILDCEGKEATAVFDAFHPWINCESMLGPYAVAILEPEDA